MTKAISSALKYESATPKKFIKRKAIMQMTNDMTLLPTHEVLRRLYKRHSVGVWETITVVTWVIVLTSKFN